MDNNLIKKAFLVKLKDKKIVVLSPHYDDAVFSAGDLLSFLISEQTNITVVNIFTKASSVQTELTKKLLKQSGLGSFKEYLQSRKKEDTLALNSIGAKSIIDLDFIDAAWRMDQSGIPIYPVTTLGEISVSDDKLEKEITTKFEELINKVHPTLIIAPLARGNHADHQLARNISLKLGKELIFYQDFPYSNKYPEDQQFILDNKLQNLNWRSEFFAQKKAAALKYTSQKNSISGYEVLEFPEETYFIQF